MTTQGTLLPIYKEIRLVLTDKNVFKDFTIYLYKENFWPPVHGQFWPRGHDFGNLGTGPLDDATCQISKF